MKIGFIGQGWIGKNYADDFEERGYPVIRYARSPEYIGNKEKIKECGIVFIAVPTPTVSEKFDDSILREVVKLVGKGNVAVIKSTLLPGTTESIQKENPDVYVFHSPEFLTEATAAHDAKNPQRNIVGIPLERDDYRAKAEEVLKVLPEAPYSRVCSSREAELIKYGGNVWFYFKVVYVNMLYDLARKQGLEWEAIRDAMAADPRIGSTHLNPVHQSSTKGGDVKSLTFNELHLEPVHKGGRGAGGHCFIKDFAAFSDIYKREVGDEFGCGVLDALRDKNIELLLDSDKDLDLLAGVYGTGRIKGKKK